MEEFKNYINGKWIDSTSKQFVDVLSPSDNKVFAKIQNSNSEDVDNAVNSARVAFESGEWSELTAVDRGRLLCKLSNEILKNKDELAEIEAKDTGKPLKQAKADIIASARYFEFYGGAADKVHGHTVPFMNDYFVSILREPHGVTAHIIPWNYPAQMFGRSLAPALAMGNAVVMKPAEEACLTPLKITQLAHDVGFPPGAINVITGIGEQAGAALSNSNDINFISFTGSPEVGTLVQIAAAKNHIGCVLELGGKSPQLVFEDANIEAALPFLVNAIVQNGGQTCSAGSRLLIQKSVYDKFVPMIAEKFSNLTVGSHSMDRDCGALISLKQKNRVLSFIDRALDSGIKKLASGKLSSDLPEEGFYVLPTLFGPVPRDHELAKDEVFGPVLSIIPFESEDEAIEIANETDYGLVAGVWTNDGARQLRVAKAMNCGQVFINGYGAGGGIELPFGGVKKSGHGREKGFEALYEFCSTKTLVFNHK